MATLFRQYSLTEVGTEEAVLVEMTAKGLVVNLTIANKLPQQNVVTLYVKKPDNTNVFLAKNLRVLGNTPIEAVKSNKIVLEAGDSLCCTCGVEDSCDIIASILEGVT